MADTEKMLEEHEHHHHDHEECGCGHEHHHHEHEHHHHHHEGPVSISHHEESVIGALKGTIPYGDIDTAESKVADAMKEAGRRITEAGGIIGHIKFVVSAGGTSSQISVTDEDESIRRFDNGSASVEGVAIVFCIEDEELEHILLDTIGALLEA